MPPDALAALVCEMTGWTFEEYAQQPARLIHYMVEFRAGRNAGREAREGGSDD